jgi:hypothetical protein
MQSCDIYTVGGMCDLSTCTPFCLFPFDISCVVLQFLDVQGCYLVHRGFPRAAGCERSLMSSLFPMDARKIVESGIVDEDFERILWCQDRGADLDQKCCAFAAKIGSLASLRWLRSVGCPWDEGTCVYAAMTGHLEVLKWALGNRCPRAGDICALAAKGGHLDVLKWARENGCPSPKKSRLF